MVYMFRKIYLTF